MRPTCLLYFGAWGGPGHYLWTAEGRRTDDSVLPWCRGKYRTGIDSTLCPALDGSEPEGKAALHHREGWTALAFWDRSQDQRLGSNSAFLAQGTHTAEEILTAAREDFPSICARFTFQIQAQGAAR